MALTLKKSEVSADQEQQARDTLDAACQASLRGAVGGTPPSQKEMIQTLLSKQDDLNTQLANLNSLLQTTTDQVLQQELEENQRHLEQELQNITAAI